MDWSNAPSRDWSIPRVVLRTRAEICRLALAAGLSITNDTTIMSDIEDELLALAGGDSEDEGSARSRGGSESPRRSRNDAGKSKKSKRRARQDDSEEEGEA